MLLWLPGQGDLQLSLFFRATSCFYRRSIGGNQRRSILYSRRPIIKRINISQDGFMTSAKASIMYNFFLKAGQLMPFPGPHVYDSRGLKHLLAHELQLPSLSHFSISLSGRIEFIQECIFFSFSFSIVLQQYRVWKVFNCVSGYPWLSSSR